MSSSARVTRIARAVLEPDRVGDDGLLRPPSNVELVPLLIGVLIGAGAAAGAVWLMVRSVR